jgi:hypothetical protein
MAAGQSEVIKEQHPVMLEIAAIGELTDRPDILD